MLNCYCPPIELVSEIKCLGLSLDLNFSWKNHVSYVKNKLVKYSRVFYLLRSYCSSQVLRKLYYGLVNSTREYRLCVWEDAYLTTLKPSTNFPKIFCQTCL